ncbi:DUF2163 domain-containing protein [Mesorhizobium sp. M7A.F.Ca.CA.001.07.2.1]|uniref:DUF2163 domain-containing protein n=1 Tax=Mesorhizobium TaxID=68287 RepID=UPI000FCAE7B0|nr:MULTISPECIES: DUF2163 domain-containing protein [Mesorhizobium]RVB25585.1 DUF2163 domain-containing protein [Mesorhizobium sp. M7A.F.Ca.CA.004.05.1.1]MCF6126072.1 DUF2163 domain-containing protein [Mesorhizobium ciceri]MCQ8813893.1 DUF2163 domain-containing protein [Mesorhizobium sp. SEMIA396]RUX79322.1 DUF2163 domain-containing protein [Mesorhizobium sp. M7A.F.Ca.CA.004.08.2.1]RUX89418.1 DUF2163 domain-containing protein [Mesorhizobium sp. M7A.F.Ca.CA.004.08.1.1]
MSFPTRLQTVLSEGRAVIRSGIKIACTTGTYGFWNGKGNIIVDGLVYWPNSLISVSEPVYGLGTAASTFTVELVAKRDSGLTPDKLLLIEDEGYKDAPVTVFDFYFDPDDRSFLHAEPGAYGFIDTVDHSRDNGEKKLIANVRSGAIANHRDGYRTASHQDQQLVSPGDRIFEFASTVRHEFFDITFD